jgi:hypothetical protein
MTFIDQTATAPVAVSTVATAVAKRTRPTYSPMVKRHVSALARQFNATRAREILNAPVGHPDAALRNSSIVPEPLGISFPTVLKYADLKGVELKRGRPLGSTNKVAVAA